MLETNRVTARASMERNVRILIIEDDPIVREHYSLVLGQAGYEVLQSATGTEGLGIFTQKHPEVVLLDLRLPDLDGKEVCQFIKADTARADTSVLLISGDAVDDYEKALGLDLGADDFLLKPISPAELLARVRSILRLRQTADSLRASEQYYRRLIDILPDAVLLVNLQGRLLSANPRALELLGYEQQSELIENSVFGLVEAAQREKFRALLGETLAAQSVRNHAFTFVCKDGHGLPVEINTASLDTAQRHSLTVVLVIRDISYRKEAEAALEKSRSLRKAILDNISDPAWLKDSRGKFLACNEALAGFYGRKADQMVGVTVFDLPITPELAKELTDEDRAVMTAKKPGRFEGERTNSRGERRWFESVKSPVFDGAGECIGTVGIARDTTDRRRLEEELRLLSRRVIEAQEAERLRVARELHDSVNQLLASVQMRLRRIEQSLAQARPSTRELLARCHEQIIAALEENRRIAHGLRPSDLDELGLAIACRNYFRQFRARSNLKVRFLVKGLDPRLPRETELNLFRIAQEALSNVEKHSQAKEVRISLVRVNTAVVLRVQDDGHGFEPNPSSLKKPKRGSGLTNMKQRAAYLGGTYEVESAPRKGTTVSVRIPLQKAVVKAVT